MTTRMSEGYGKVITESDQILMDAINTTPLPTKGFEFWLVNGRNPREIGEDEFRDYLRECKERDVVPFSFRRFDSYGSGEFFPNKTTTFTPIFLLNEDKSEMNREMNYGIISGGRPSMVLFQSTYREGGDSFELFKESYMNNLLDNGYTFHSGGIYFGTKDFMGLRETGTLGFNKGESGMEVGLSFMNVVDREGIPLEDKANLCLWFEKLDGELVL